MSLHTEELPPQTPAEFDEYVSRFLHWGNNFKDRKQLEYFLMLPISKHQRVLLLQSVLGLKVKGIVYDAETKHNRHDVGIGCILCVCKGKFAAFCAGENKDESKCL